MLNVCLICANSIDATSFYRGWGVFSDLMKKIDINISTINEANWATISTFDLFILQRPYSDSHLKIVELLKLQNKKLWIDYDDDLFSIPEDNPCFSLYNEPVQNNIKKIIAQADVVTVTTEVLKNKLAFFNQNIHIVPNALNTNIIELPKKKKENDRPYIFWRGSQTHKKDLDSVAENIIKLSKKYTCHWIFFGDNPWFTNLIDKKQLTIFKAIDPLYYFRFMNQVTIDIQIVPLIDIPFNRAKSNCSWLEGSYAGAKVLAPDFEEFQKPGIVNYINDKDFYTKLEQMIINYKKKDDASIKYIVENLTLDIVNRKRIEILENLFK